MARPYYGERAEKMFKRFRIFMNNDRWLSTPLRRITPIYDFTTLDQSKKKILNDFGTTAFIYDSDRNQTYRLNAREGGWIKEEVRNK